MKDVTLIVKFKVDEDAVIDFNGLYLSDYAEAMAVDVKDIIQADWHVEDLTVTAEVETEPEPPKSDTPGHLITLVKVNLTDYNDLTGIFPTCACGKKWGVDGETAYKPFRSQELAQRVGDLHIYKVKKGIEE